MNWIKNFVRPRFPSVFREHDDTPDNLWEACKKCGEMIFHRDLENLQKVCPGCDHHMRIGAKERFDALFDKGVYELIDLPDVAHDPLKFKDQKKYAERLKDARAKSGDKGCGQSRQRRFGRSLCHYCRAGLSFYGGLVGHGCR
jgi:acetyl-CoA carboxylase carboxyl transferase subunit beta